MNPVVNPSLPAREPFNPMKASASRMNKLSECGVAFKMQYIERVPTTRQGSHALFGRVVHLALEKWSVDRSLDLVELVRDAWATETEGSVVADFLAEYRKINISVMKAEIAAREAFNANPRNKNPCAAPRMTKHFKESAAAKALEALHVAWADRLQSSEWEFTDRDPLAQFYDDSLKIAKRYQRQYKHLPPSLHTEFSFDVPWGGSILNGYIDSIEILVSPDGEIQGIGVLDYKTYKAEPAPFKDWRQLAIYDVAVRYLIENGALQLPYSLDEYPLYVGVDYVRMAGTECQWIDQETPGYSRIWMQMTSKDHERLARELENFRGIAEGGYFQPAPKGMNPSYCDYGESCCLVSTSMAGGSAEIVKVVQ